MAEVSFLLRVTGLSIRDRMRRSDIWRELEIETLLLFVGSVQFRQMYLFIPRRSIHVCRMYIQYMDIDLGKL